MVHSDWRASLVPAAAVIPAPVVHIHAVVRKFVAYLWIVLDKRTTQIDLSFD